MQVFLKRISFFVFVVWGCSVSNAQRTADAGLWSTLNLDVGLTKRLSTQLTQEFRLKENLSRLNQLYTCLGMEYRVQKNLRTSLTYRFTNKYQDDNSFSFKHRLMLDITMKKKLGKVGLSYRHRFQVEERDIYSSDKGRIPEWHSRSKIAMKLDLDKAIVPYLSAEFQYQIRSLQDAESNHSWQRARFVGGVDYKMNKMSSVGLYYLVQFEYNINAPEDQYIVGLEYSHSL